jgi:hypothetical protein
MNGPTDGPEWRPEPGLTALTAGLLAAAVALSTCYGCEEPGPFTSLIGRHAERPVDKEKRRGLDGKSVRAGAGRAAALDRAAPRAIAADGVCSHGKLGEAAG